MRGRTRSWGNDPQLHCSFRREYAPLGGGVEQCNLWMAEIPHPARSSEEQIGRLQSANIREAPTVLLGEAQYFTFGWKKRRNLPSPQAARAAVTTRARSG